MPPTTTPPITSAPIAIFTTPASANAIDHQRITSIFVITVVLFATWLFAVQIVTLAATQAKNLIRRYGFLYCAWASIMLYLLIRGYLLSGSSEGYKDIE